MAILPDALQRHAGEQPEAPWLFWAEGWDWRWLSWGEAARRVAAEADTFAGAPPRVPFRYRPTPAALLTDLAIQAAGRVPVPLAEGEVVPPMGVDLGTPEPVAKGPSPLGGGGLEKGGGQEGGGHNEGNLDGGSPHLDPPPVPTLPLPEGGRPLPKPLVLVRGSGGDWVEWGDDDLLAAAGLVARAVAPAGPPAGGREILVSCRPLAEPAERAVLAWALLQGAALILEPDPAAFVATAAWARPTFFHGTAVEIAALARQAEIAPRPLARLFRRPPGLPFGRLRAVLPLGPGPAPEEAAFWTGRGAHLAAPFVLPR